MPQDRDCHVCGGSMCVSTIPRLGWMCDDCGANNFDQVREARQKAKRARKRQERAEEDC